MTLCLHESIVKINVFMISFINNLIGKKNCYIYPITTSDKLLKAQYCSYNEMKKKM